MEQLEQEPLEEFKRRARLYEEARHLANILIWLKQIKSTEELFKNWPHGRLQDILHLLPNDLKNLVYLVTKCLDISVGLDENNQQELSEQ
jgi:hypothetical protein